MRQGVLRTKQHEAATRSADIVQLCVYATEAVKQAVPAERAYILVAAW